MSLPRELREMVFAADLADLPSTIILRPGIYQNNHRFPAIVPALCYVNKQVFEESLPMLLRNKQIIVAADGCAPSLLANFLDQISDGKGFKAVTRLQLESLFHTANWKRTFQTPPSARLLNLCTGLQRLRITVHAISFANFLDDFSYPKWTRMSRVEVLSRFDFHQVYDLPNLRSFVLGCLGGQSYVTHTGCTETAIFEHLTTWLRDEHQRRHAQFDLQIKYEPGDIEWLGAEFLGWGPEEVGE
jgi:hypothetical protein